MPILILLTAGLGLVFVLFAVLCYPNNILNRIGKLRSTLDGLLIVLALFISLWTIYLNPLQKTLNLNNKSYSSLLFVPVIGLIVFAVTLETLARSQKNERFPLIIITTGLAVDLITQFYFVSISTSYYPGSIVDTGWSLTPVIIALGTSKIKNKEKNDLIASSNFVGSFVPYFFACGATVVLCIVMSVGKANIIHGIAGGFMLLTVVTRQMVALLENQMLFKKVEYQSLHDSLTGLANRNLFADRLIRLAAKSRSDHRCAVISCDIDDFKKINDTYGHAAGDTVLVAVAERLVAITRG